MYALLLYVGKSPADVRGNAGPLNIVLIFAPIWFGSVFH